MKRREFITLVGGAAVAWQRPAYAQHKAFPIVGFLRSAALVDVSHWVTAFGQGLKEAGMVEGQNVTVEYHSAENRKDRLQRLAAEMTGRPVDLIFGDNNAALVAKSLTTTVPIVFAGGGDPVQQGLVASLNRPGGNVTGVSFFGGVLGSKRLELLRQVAPRAKAIGMLVNPGTPTTEAERSDVQAAARAIGQELVIFDASTDRDIENAFTAFAQRGVGALLVGGGPFMTSRREKIIPLADRHALPAIYVQRESVTAGGLMSYGSNITDAYRLAGLYAGRILKGEKPADLPVVQPTKFEFVLNLKAAKAIGLDVPDRLLALADEVIE